LGKGGLSSKIFISIPFDETVLMSHHQMKSVVMPNPQTYFDKTIAFYQYQAEFNLKEPTGTKFQHRGSLSAQANYLNTFLLAD
jgi:hypothetical protein